MGEFFIKVKLANEHILALTNHGDVYAWGTNTYGQVGIEQNEDWLSKGVKRIEECTIGEPKGKKRKTRKEESPEIIDHNVYEPVKVFPTSENLDSLGARKIYALEETSIVQTSNSSCL